MARLSNEERTKDREAIERNGRHEETRTPDLDRVKAHLFNPFDILHRRWGRPNPCKYA
jgi:hypothetical protein